MTSRDLSIAELITIADKAQVFRLMGEGRRNKITVDYVPPREPMIIPRGVDEEGSITVYPADAVEIDFRLEDAMFSGVIYVALTCGHRVIVNPFPWVSYDKLASTTLATR